MKNISLCLTALSFTVLSLCSAKAATANSLGFNEKCTPKRANTHSCLEDLPTYSYHLVLPSHYKQTLCLSLGSWEGENEIVVEWDGLQMSHTIQGEANAQQLLQPNLRSGTSSGIVVYSNQPIFPDLIQAGCQAGQSDAVAVTEAQWPNGETPAGPPQDVAQSGALAQ